MKARLKATQQKVISYSWVPAITHEPNENPIAFLETLQKFTNLDLDSYDVQVILFYLFFFEGIKYFVQVILKDNSCPNVHPTSR